ncbi:hypothetical protein T06_3089 [Trichinella sp. T6]|nr:hypothetical protein T06_3089 [Trichinella sp. T6]
MLFILCTYSCTTLQNVLSVIIYDSEISYVSYVMIVRLQQ